MVGIVILTVQPDDMYFLNPVFRIFQSDERFRTVFINADFLDIGQISQDIPTWHILRIWTKSHVYISS